MDVSKQCIEVLKHYEGCRLTAYKCSAGIWTIGYGNTFYEDGSAVQQGDTITQERAESLLLLILGKFSAAVSKHMVVPVKQHEFDAMVCLCYNIGPVAFERSTLLKKVKAKAAVNEITAEFRKWTRSKGKELPGLVKRRNAEAHLYEHGSVKIF